MNLYSLIKPWLMTMDPELAHHITLKSIQIAQSTGLLNFAHDKPVHAPYDFCGLKLTNRVGLAAGLDKDGRYIDALANLGFGYLEIGTVTPKPQSGNPKPRMFRLPQVGGIINRMGFNNDGVDACVERVKRSKYWQSGGILGLNIGKNASTAMEAAANDYVTCMQKVYDVASYITINISSPNTKNLRQLQGADELSELLSIIHQQRIALIDTHQKRVPLFLKIAPDLDQAQVSVIAELLLKFEIDAVIATNTTITRNSVEHLPFGNELGGLSGKPVFNLSNRVISDLHQHLKGHIPIIGVGGIFSANDALEKINCGASVVQIYSGLIYEGPHLITACANALK